MFSRSGKSTISQYTAFSKKHKARRPELGNPKENEEVDLDDKDDF